MSGRTRSKSEASSASASRSATCSAEVAGPDGEGLCGGVGRTDGEVVDVGVRLRAALAVGDASTVSSCGVRMAKKTPMNSTVSSATTATNAMFRMDGAAAGRMPGLAPLQQRQSFPGRDLIEAQLLDRGDLGEVLPQVAVHGRCG